MNPFQNVMQAKSDEELVEIVSRNRADYQTAALEAAENELASRNLSARQLAFKAKIIDARNHRAELKANEPLDWYWWIPAVLFPGLFLLVINLNFQENGYFRKARQLNQISLYTLGGIVVIVSLFVLFS